MRTLIERFVANRRQEIEDERLKLRSALAGSGGFTSPKAMEFMTAMRLRLITLDELEKLAEYLPDSEPVSVPETAEAPQRRPGRQRKADA